MKHTYLYISAALLLLAGCTADEAITPDDGRIPVRLTASQGDVSLADGTTRADDGLYDENSGWDGGEVIKVYMNSTDESSDYTISTDDKQTLTGGTLTYPTSGDVTLFAVYPSTSVSSHTVKYDQTSTDNYKASDLMFSTKAVSQSDKDDTQDLEFEHQLAKLKVNIVKASDVTAVTSVKMKNVLRTVALDPSTSSIGLGSINGTPEGNADYNSTDNNAILLSNTSNSDASQTYCCVFPAAQQWSGTDFIEVTADGKTLSCTLTRTSFTAGCEYELTLNVNAASLGTTVSITGWSDTTPSVTVNPTVIEQQVVTRIAATSSDIGKVICNNGHIHATVSDATANSCTASGIIAWVGAYGDVETGNNQYKGLAIALTDCNSSNCTWNDVLNDMIGYCSQNTEACYAIVNGYSTALETKNGLAATSGLLNHSTHTHYAANAVHTYNVIRPTDYASEWFLPSMGQWQLIVRGLTNNSTLTFTDNSSESNTGMDITPINAKITAAGGTGLQGADGYWTTTEGAVNSVMDVMFTNGWGRTAGDNKLRGDNKSGANWVRAVFAF